jgi:hypothetical protein
MSLITIGVNLVYSVGKISASSNSWYEKILVLVPFLESY